MTVEYFQAKGALNPGGSYSHGVVVHGFLYTCGMGPVDPATKKVVEGGISEQTLHPFQFALPLDQILRIFW